MTYAALHRPCTSVLYSIVRIIINSVTFSTVHRSTRHPDIIRRQQRSPARFPAVGRALTSPEQAR